MNLTKRITVVTKLLLIIFVLVFSLVSISATSAIKIDQRELNENEFTPKLEKSSKLSSNGETIFLPGTNLSVSEYLDGSFQNTFNSSIETMNTTHLNVRCDYSIDQDWFGSPIPQTFYSTVNRTGYHHIFNVTDYYNWQGFSADAFDFWSDTSEFNDGFTYTSGGVLITVAEVNNFYLAGMGNYDSWKQTGTDPAIGPFTIYSSKQGLFLSMEFTYISEFCYNLTSAEFNEGPEGTIDSPLSGVVGLQLTVEWSSTDNQSSVLNQTVYVNREQSRELIATTGIRSTGSQSITVFTTSLTEGPGYYIELELNDGFITTTVTTSSSTFTIDRNNTLPVFTIISPENSGYYQSDVLLQYANDTDIDSFYLDGISQNIPESGHILTSLYDGSHNLTLIATDALENDFSVTVTFTVDTVQPVITIEGIANTTYRVNLLEFGTEVNEVSITRVTISNTFGKMFYNTTFSAWTGDSFPNIVSDLKDGYYLLTVNATDRAGNNAEVKLYFTVHISSFELNWMLEAKTPRAIPVVDENGTLWFDLTLTSKTQQNFTLKILTAGELTGPGNQIQSAVKFTCDTPEDIIYMSFAYEVNDTSAIDPNIPVHQWIYWDNSTESWIEISTSFNYLSFTWEATIEGSLTFIALTVTDETLNVAEITNTELFPTPSMEIVTAILSMFSAIFLRRKLTKTKTKK